MAGNTISEVITGATGGNTSGSKAFKTVTSITRFKCRNGAERSNVALQTLELISLKLPNN